MRVPWTARRSSQSILKEISPGIYLEEMMLKLKLQYFGLLTQIVGETVETVADFVFLALKSLQMVTEAMK